MSEVATSPKTLRSWKAKRAGEHITIYGINIETGKEDKITNVTQIVPPAEIVKHEVAAVDKHGTEHRLVFA